MSWRPDCPIRCNTFSDDEAVAYAAQSDELTEEAFAADLAAAAAARCPALTDQFLASLYPRSARYGSAKTPVSFRVDALKLCHCDA